MLVTWWMAQATAAVLEVGPGRPYATVSGAIADAADGDVVLVHDTLVDEAVVVDGLQLVIRAATRATWQQSVASTDVQLRDGASVVLTNFDFVGDGSDSAVRVESSHLLVRGSTFTGFETAVLGGLAASSVRVFRSRFVANETAIAFYTSPGGRIDVVASVFVDNGGVDMPTIDAGYSDGATTTVIGSLFARNRGGGTGAVFCDTCTITDSVFVGNGQDDALATASVWSSGPGPMVLERNLFCGNENESATVYALGPSSTTLRNNAFIENDGVYGALMSEDAVLVHNTFLDTSSYVATAVVEYGSNGTTFVGNLVAGTIWTGGTYLLPASYGPMTSTYGAWFDNDGGHADDPLGPTELVDVDPMLSGAGPRCSWDRIRPLPGSPLIDGDPTMLDADGSPADIGATGGPWAP